MPLSTVYGDRCDDDYLPITAYRDTQPQSDAQVSTREELLELAGVCVPLAT